MSSRDDSARAFEEAMRGVQRVSSSRRRGWSRGRRPTDVGSAAPLFAVSHEGSRICGLREGTARSEMEALREGDPRPQNRLDLHGMTEEAAREGVFQFIRQARASGLVCVTLVHGRGLRSPAGPVLKEALPGWLTQLPLALEVAAFASAPSDQGGDGATWVLLARR